MRLLFVTNLLPYPARDGGRIRKLRLALALSEAHQLWMMGASPSSEERDAFLAEHPQIRFVEIPYRPERGPVPVASAARELVAGASFDALHVAGTRQWPGEAAAAGARLVLDTDNVESVVLERMKPLPGATISDLDVLAIRELERQAFGQADRVLVCSQADAGAALELTPDAAVRVVPNGVDLRYFAFSEPESPGDEVTICFTGLLSWWPNADACAHFARDVLPLVRTELPGARFQIVGRYPPEKVMALRGAAVDVAPDVPDVRPYLSAADVFAVPMRAGGGTRLKILEALASGVPVVSTAVGAEGLDVEDGQHLLIASSPDAFAEAIVNVVHEPERSRERAVRGRALVEERYGWEVVGATLREVYEDLEGTR